MIAHSQLESPSVCVCVWSSLFNISYGMRPNSSEPTKVDLSAVEVDPAHCSGAERDRGVRRPRRYITPGLDSRMSERFRTQPITSAERMESHRYRKEDFTIKVVQKVLCGFLK